MQLDPQTATAAEIEAYADEQGQIEMRRHEKTYGRRVPGIAAACEAGTLRAWVTALVAERDRLRALLP